MTQTERRSFLIQRLLAEQPRYRGLTVPNNPEEQKKFLRSLMNIRMPAGIGDDFLAVQDEYLREETAAKGITDLADLSPRSEGLYLWQGDITTLRCDAIVNAANSGITLPFLLKFELFEIFYLISLSGKERLKFLHNKTFR